MFYTEQEVFEKFSPKIRRLLRKIKTNELDDFDLEFIDIDLLMQMYIDEFKSFRKSTVKRIQKTY